MESTRFDTALGKANENLKKTARGATARAGGSAAGLETGYAPKITFVVFDELVEYSPAQSRTRIFDPGMYPEDRELFDSIQARGVITPIIVRSLETEGEKSSLAGFQKRGERSFALVSGHRRVEAAKLAGLKGVPGILAKDEDDHALITLAENMGRRELSTYERAAAILSLKEERGLSIRKTAAVTGLSKSVVARMVYAFDAPEALRELWKKGALPIATLEVLKRHWDQFEGDLSRSTLSKVAGLSRRDAGDLCALLDTGTDLEAALGSLGGLNQDKGPEKKRQQAAVKHNEARASAKKDGDNKRFKSEQKEALIKAMAGVFPKLKSGLIGTLFDLAIVSNVKDTEVLWAAALYVSRGGKVDTAIEKSLQVMQDRKIRSLINREVKQMKQVSGKLRGAKKGDRDTRQYLRTIFAGS